MRAVYSGVRALLALSLVLAAGGVGADHHETQGRVVQVVTTVVGGKNVFIPSTIVVMPGQPTTLSIFNTTDKPHGFRIPALKIEAILPSQQEFVLSLPALEGGEVYEIGCHLHPPHRTATLVVLPTR